MTDLATLPPPTGARRAGRPLRPALAGAAALGVCVVVNVVDPNEPGSLGTCPFLWATGLDCPGCGTLRALRATTRGDLLAAADHNLLTLLLLPVLLLALLGWWRTERGGRPWLPRTDVVAPAMAVVVPVWWIARNVPSWSWLSSGLG